MVLAYSLLVTATSTPSTWYPINGECRSIWGPRRYYASDAGISPLWRRERSSLRVPRAMEWGHYSMIGASAPDSGLGYSQNCMETLEHCRTSLWPRIFPKSDSPHQRLCIFVEQNRAASDIEPKSPSCLTRSPPRKTRQSTLTSAHNCCRMNSHCQMRFLI